jgi:hypothetical protein
VLIFNYAPILPSFIASPSDWNSVLVRGNLFSQQNERPFEVKTKKTFSPALPERFDLVKNTSLFYTKYTICPIHILGSLKYS